MQPGVIMYGDEWWNIVSTKHNIPKEYKNIIQEISFGLQLGNDSDILFLYNTISKWKSLINEV